jgi:hypothetical protein
MSKTTDTILVSCDFGHGKDGCVLIVARKCMNQDIDIINAFQGEEAERIYNLLVTKKS